MTVDALMIREGSKRIPTDAMDVDPRHTVRRPVLERDPPRRTAGTPGRERAAYAVHRYRDTPERYPPI